MKISRPPSPMTRAAARAPRKAPVRFTSRTCRQTDAPVSRGPATTGEMPALQIHTSTPPHSATVASATASLKSSSVTSPLSTRDGPGSVPATVFKSFSVRATSATDAPASENPCASSAPRPRLAPVITTRFPATAPGPGNDSGISIWSAIASSLVVPTSTIHIRDRRPPLLPRRFSAADLARDAPPDAADPRLRGAGGRALPRRRGPRLRAPLDRAGGGGRRRVLAARARRTSSPPPTAATATAWPRVSTRSGCSPS